MIRLLLSTHTKIIRDALEAERSSIAWAFRHWPARRDMRVNRINSALESLRLIEEHCEDVRLPVLPEEHAQEVRHG